MLTLISCATNELCCMSRMINSLTDIIYIDCWKCATIAINHGLVILDHHHALGISSPHTQK